MNIIEQEILKWVVTTAIVMFSAIVAVKSLFEKRMAVAEKRIHFMRRLSLESHQASQKAEKAANEAKIDMKFFVQEVKHELAEQTLLITNLVEKIESERHDLVREIAKIERLDDHISKMVDIIDKKLK